MGNKITELEKGYIIYRDRVTELETEVSRLNSLIDHKSIEIEVQKAKMSKIKRCIKNPIYGIYTAYLYLKSKSHSNRSRDGILKRESLIKRTGKEYEAYILDLEENEREILPVRSYDNIKVLSGSYTEYDKKSFRATLEGVEAEYILLLNDGDILSENALYEFSKVIESSKAVCMVYADEDEIKTDEDETSGEEHRANPIFKPDYSPDTLMSFDYIGDICLFNKAMLLECDLESIDMNSAWRYELRLMMSERSSDIVHISKVLLHKKSIDKINQKDEIAAKKRAIARRGLDAFVEEIADIKGSHIVYNPVGNPLVSILIPSKDHPDVLKTCIDSIVEKTSYKNYEIVVVDNGSSDENKAEYEAIVRSAGGTYVYEKRDFNFSYMCNRAAKESKGEYLLFLNDDTEVISDTWLERMLGHAQLPHVGAVGAKLYYSDSRMIQHMGVIIRGTGPDHLAYVTNDAGNLYNFRNFYEYDWMAVTAACLMVSREKYNKAGGFKEILPVAYNDVDFCFELIEEGLYNVVREDALLYHHESISRGNDLIDDTKLRRLAHDLFTFRELHSWFKSDGFFSRFYSQDGAYHGYEMLSNIRAHKTDETFKSAGRMYKCRFDNEDFFGGLGNLQGWAIKLGTRDILADDIKLYFKGTAESYLLDTIPVYRPDVEIIFPFELEAAFCGFKTVEPARFIPAGEYDLYVYYSGHIIDLNRHVEIFGK